jgi:hypothetical protein
VAVFQVSVRSVCFPCYPKLGQSHRSCTHTEELANRSTVTRIQMHLLHVIAVYDLQKWAWQILDVTILVVRARCAEGSRLSGDCDKDRVNTMIWGKCFQVAYDANTHHRTWDKHMLANHQHVCFLTRVRSRCRAHEPEVTRSGDGGRWFKKSVHVKRPPVAMRSCCVGLHHHWFCGLCSLVVRWSCIFHDCVCVCVWWVWSRTQLVLNMAV